MLLEFCVLGLSFAQSIRGNSVEVRLLSYRKYVNEPWRTILILVGAVIVSNSFVIFSNQDSRDFFTNWTINAAAAAALSFSILTVITASNVGSHRSLHTIQDRRSLKLRLTTT
jgi:hypothetical protein